MTYKSRITTAIATGAVLVYALAPLALADTATVSGNGALSNNAVNVTNSSNTVVNQTNNSNISNHISSNASTGGNSSNFNTGGNATISTGNAKNTVTVNNASNLNQASVPSVSNDPTTVTVGDNNGYDSKNGVTTTSSNNVFLNQTNNAKYNNDIDANSTTGKNDSSFNTGGSTVVVTGNAKTNVSVNNAANANFATVGGNNGSADPSNVTVQGNGAFSKNGVVLDQDSAIVLSQYNASNIKNDVDANAETGDNKSHFNTGGSNGIATGNATDKVSVNNYTNFNDAELGSDMTLSPSVSVTGNGAKSKNAVTASSDNEVFPDQMNDAGLWNDVSGSSQTGDNSLAFNNAHHNGDQVIFTGNGKSSTDVNNAGNVNVLDNGNSINLPGNWNVGVNFDLKGLKTFFNGLM